MPGNTDYCMSRFADDGGLMPGGFCWWCAYPFLR